MADRPLGALIVDDEPLARAALRVLCAADPEVCVVGECGSGTEAVERIASAAPALLFLDVQMPGMDGFEVLRRIGPNPPVVVFTTAYDEYALRAFEVNAIDYLLKPFDDERFARALARAKAQARAREVEDLVRRLSALVPESRPPAGTPTGAQAPPAEDPLPARPPTEPAGAPGGEPLARIAVRDGSRLRLVAVADIDWISADDYYVEIHAGAQTYLARESLQALERQLAASRFARVHRSAIVNLDRVREIRSDGRDQVCVLANGTELPVSRSRRQSLFARLGAGDRAR
ncbi:MAG TPA: LytTR family DNA-binding domain-containing protein [Kofleriaceae bacterium]|nr:LytTR family DNA-binding domain-containing protein [Kofleriaceae bacterium]